MFEKHAWDALLCSRDTCSAALSRVLCTACCHVTVTVSLSPCSDSRLKLSQAQGNLSILETRQIQLECVVLNRTSVTSQLMVEWFVWKPNHPEREVVAHLSRDATFHYGEQAAKNNLKGRLHLESPSSGVYRLFIQNVAVQDSGTYSCRVEEWLPSPSGVWYKRAEDTAGQTVVTVMRPGKVPTLPCFRVKNILDACIGTYLVSVTKCPTRGNLREEGLV